MMSDNNKIVSITMFGGKGFFGGREKRREVDISRCSFAEECPALKAGRCASNNPRMQSCKYQSVDKVQGYTSRSRNFSSFMNKWKGHEKYKAVNRSLRRFEHVGNNKVRIELPHIDIEKALNGEKGYRVLEVGKPHYIDRNKFGVNELIKIMESYSRSAMGGNLYNEEEKEEMLLAIKSVDKELYEEYTKETGTDIDCVGRVAYLHTLKPNIELTENWFWDGKYLTKEESNRITCGAIRGFPYGSEIRFKPEKDTEIEINDNSWVTDQTQFKW